jgi:ribosomal protein L7/L12
MGLFDFLNPKTAAAPPEPEYVEPQLIRLERKVDALMDALDIAVPAASDGGLPPEVRHALASGRKIEAIRLYRERTGVGLAEAKNAVEGGKRASSPWTLLEHKLDLVLSNLGIEVPSGAATPDAYDEVESMVREGQLIQAIKLYRQRTGLGLKESKDAIDTIKRRIESGRGR